ncbi:iron-containing alcohol dehydrogenase [Pectinatus frisingensis]|uniref:iron-containing alcohol dehydrogenase n=1 Tax=Pectinatus frisingensis TaxID=865 RepID=UPI0018C4D7B0|nr:iron-containing alcohol dehydrogenase [Pectinatus frisingensis]
MKILRFHGENIVNGVGSLAYLKKIPYKRAMVITGGKSMYESGIIDKIEKYMEKPDSNLKIYSGISKNPTKYQVNAALETAKLFKPDTFIAVGGGSPLDAAKAVLLFYEFPELNFDNIFDKPLPIQRKKTKFIAIPSTSGTASEVTHVSVITYPEENLKLAIKAECLRPDITILDGNITMSLPPHIAAQTGMDALTHALESYINTSGDDFTDALAKSAIEGILHWLPISCKQGTLESRQKMHAFQCMAGMSFSNAGLGMVHGVSHAFGGMYNLAHGLTNAVILPYSMDYNKRNIAVAKKYKIISHAIDSDIIEKVRELSQEINIPACIKDAGVNEKNFIRNYDKLVENAMLGSTMVNPIKVSVDDMKIFIRSVYYGNEINWG